MLTVYMYVIGILAIAYTGKFHKELMRFEWKTIKDFLKFLATVLLTRIVLYNIFPEKGNEIISKLSGAEWWQMVMAGFEEAMFTLPAYFILIFADNKFIKHALIGAVALAFSLGHAYQGLYGMVITFGYMFFAAPRLMKKFGFYTMVVCHILFDLNGWVFIRFSDKLLFNFQSMW